MSLQLSKRCLTTCCVYSSGSRPCLRRPPSPIPRAPGTPPLLFSPNPVTVCASRKEEQSRSAAAPRLCPAGTGASAPGSPPAGSGLPASIFPHHCPLRGTLAFHSSQTRRFSAKGSSVCSCLAGPVRFRRPGVCVLAPEGSSSLRAPRPDWPACPQHRPASPSRRLLGCVSRVSMSCSISSSLPPRGFPVQAGPVLGSPPSLCRQSLRYQTVRTLFP